MEQSTIDEGKTAAIVSYIFTPIGLIIAYFMNNSSKNAFANFHIGQSVRLFILSIVINIGVSVLVSVTGIGLLSLLGWVPLILMILGIVNAVNGKDEPLPVIGTIGGK